MDCVQNLGLVLENIKTYFDEIMSEVVDRIELIIKQRGVGRFLCCGN